MNGEDNPYYIAAQLDAEHAARQRHSSRIQQSNDDRAEGGLFADIFNLQDDENVHAYGRDEAEEDNRRNPSRRIPVPMAQPARAENMDYEYRMSTGEVQRAAQEAAERMNRKIKAKERAIRRKRVRLGIDHKDAVEEIQEPEHIIERRRIRRARRRRRAIILRNHAREERRREQEERRELRASKRARADEEEMVNLFRDDDNEKGEEGEESEEESSEEEFSEISSNEEEGRSIAGITSSDESDSDAVEDELPDPDDTTKMVWSRGGKVRPDCEVCRQLIRDVHGTSMVGKIRQKIEEMFDKALSSRSVSPEIIVDEMVRANNIFVVRPLQATKSMVPHVTAVDWYKHYGIGQYFSTVDMCVFNPNLEMYKSTIIYSSLESEIHEKQLRIVHPATGRQSMDPAGLRNLMATTRVKMMLIKDNLTVTEKMLRNKKLELENAELEGSAVDTNLLTNNTTAVAGSVARLNGISMASFRETQTITSESIYKITARAL